MRPHRRRPGLPAAAVLAVLAVVVLPQGAPAGAAVDRNVAVYFLRDEHLAPVRRTAVGPAVATQAIRALLRGPTASERATGLASAVPTGTRLRSLTVARGTATIDLSRRFGSGGGSLSMTARLGQVTYTLTQFPTVQRVVYLIEGRRVRALGGEGVLVDRPQTRARYERGRPDTLEAALLGPILVERPAQGAALTGRLVLSGSATRTFTVLVAGTDGRILAKRTVENETGTRQPFRRVLRVDSGRYRFGALVVRDPVARRTVRIPLGTIGG